MDIENFIAEFKKTFVYDMLSMSLKDEQLFEHVVDDDGVLWFKEQTRQMWSMWQAAKAQAIPDGFVLVNKKDLVKVLNCVTDDWLVDTDSFEEFKKIESLVQDEVNVMIEALEQAND